MSTNICEPYRPGTEALIRADHEQRAILTLTDGSSTWTPGPLSGALTLSEDWTPTGQLSAVIGDTFTAAELGGMDPRAPYLVTLEAGYVYPDGSTDLHTVFTGQLDARTVKRPGGLIDLSASGEEQAAVEARWLEPDAWKTFPGVTEAVEWLAGYATGSTVVANSSLGTGYRPDLASSIPLEIGVSLWEVISAVALSAGVRVYVDPAGVWTIGPKASEATQTAVFLEDGNGSTVDTWEDVLTRDGYYGSAVIHFEWKDAAGDSHKVTGVHGPAGSKTYEATRKAAASQNEANEAARLTVEQLSTRGNSYKCTGVAAYWLRPGMTVQITMANGTTARHLVRSVTFQYTAGTMTVITREPNNLGV